MKLFLKFNVENKMKEFGLDKTLDIPIVKNKNFTLDLENLITLILEHKLDKFKTRKSPTMEANSTPIFQLCIRLIQHDLISNIDETIEVYNIYLKENNRKSYINHSIGNIAVDFLTEIIILELIKKEFFIMPVAFVHRNAKDRKKLLEFKKEDSYLDKHMDNWMVYEGARENIIISSFEDYLNEKYPNLDITEHDYLIDFNPKDTFNECMYKMLLSLSAKLDFDFSYDDFFEFYNKQKYSFCNGGSREEVLNNNNPVKCDGYINIYSFSVFEHDILTNLSMGALNCHNLISNQNDRLGYNFKK